jgi:hypothetical protein
MAFNAGVMAKPSAVFTPTSVAGCALWLDSDDASSFTFGVGSKVAQWNDKSGNSQHVLQATAGNQPSRNATYGAKTAVNFDGSQSHQLRNASAVTISQPYTMFAVAAIQGATRAAARILSHRSTNNVQFLIGELSSNPSLYAGTGFVSQGSVPSTGVLQQLSGVANGASSQVWGNGSAGSAGNAGSGSLDLVTIGSSGRAITTAVPRSRFVC